MKKIQRNIIIIGFKACGKSTIGRALARRLTLDFTDLDEAIEDAHGRRTGETMPCREIYRRFGKGYFRELEQKVLGEVVNGREGVIALGGGSLAEAADPEALLCDSFCIYLTVEPKTLFARVMAGGVPAFFDHKDPWASFQELHASRTPLYLRLSDVIVDNTSRPVDGVVEEIVGALKKEPSPHQ